MDYDYELLKRTASGDEGAFEELVRRYRDRLLRFCYRFVKDVYEAEDIVQEVFVNVYRFAPHFVPRASVGAFIFKVAANQCLNTLKKRRRERKAIPSISLFRSLGGEGGELVDMLAAPLKQPGEEMEREEAKREFLEALEKLPPKHRAALLMFELDGLSYNEIAEVMEASLAEVKIWIYRARRKLAALLKDKDV